tara:strand:- start:1945 stop:2529 length:585 start_codon:yes stop_codon:yes gene_type:complete
MKKFNKPNLKAPRFREKQHIVYNKKLYKEFLKKFPEHVNVTLLEFKKIIETFNGMMWQGVIDNRNGVELPEGLGYVFIASCIPSKTKKNVDFKKSAEYGVITNHKNWDSDNFLMKIFFTNTKVRYNLPNKELWSFYPVRAFKRKASKIYKENWAKYIAVDNTKRITTIFEKQQKRDYFNKKSSKVSDDYNEFKM